MNERNGAGGEVEGSLPLAKGEQEGVLQHSSTEESRTPLDPPFVRGDARPDRIGARSEQTTPARLRTLLLAIAFEGGLGVLAIGLGWLLRVSPTRTLDRDPRNLVIGLIATVPLFALFAVLASSRWRPLVRIRRLLVRFVGVFFGECNWLELALVCIAAGFGEELLFRGLIQAGLSRAFGPTLALTLTSVVFGLAHLITPLYGALATVMCAYLGAVWLATGSLTAVVTAHAFYDLVVLCWLHRVWWQRYRRRGPRVPPRERVLMSPGHGFPKQNP